MQPIRELNRHPDMASRIWLGSAILVFLIGFYLAMAAPPDENQGYLVRILYLHVGVAWTGYLSFAVAAVYAVLYLVRGKAGFDRMSSASVELGVLFTALTLVSGMLWGRPTWGVYWVWSPRLTTSAILFAVFVAYFLLRQSIEDPEFRARVAASHAILGLVMVPISYMSVYWWRGMHQTATISIITGQVHMAGGMLLAMLVNLLAFNLLYIGFMRVKGILAARQAALEEAE